jgi:hypothetical protein
MVTETSTAGPIEMAIAAAMTMAIAARIIAGAAGGTFEFASEGSTAPFGVDPKGPGDKKGLIARPAARLAARYLLSSA